VTSVSLICSNVRVIILVMILRDSLNHLTLVTFQPGLIIITQAEEVPGIWALAYTCLTFSSSPMTQTTGKN